jgi:hypothetical protein
MGFVEPFDDGERLGQHSARIILQRRDEPLRIDGEIGGGALFALAKVMCEMFAAQAFQVQGDSDPVGRAAAVVAMQLHRTSPYILLVRSIDATHIVSMLSIGA